jgi:hypothetical protein
MGAALVRDEQAVIIALCSSRVSSLARASGRAHPRTNNSKPSQKGRARRSHDASKTIPAIADRDRADSERPKSHRASRRPRAVRDGVALCQVSALVVGRRLPGRYRDRDVAPPTNGRYKVVSGQWLPLSWTARRARAAPRTALRLAIPCRVANKLPLVCARARAVSGVLTALARSNTSRRCVTAPTATRSD